jgi:predicted nucleotidyltransferase component of viral defense system
MKEQALKDRLLRISKEQGIHFNQCWKNLILERFLARLSRSSEKEKFIFKGGFLLSYVINIGRETMDLDFLLQLMEVSEEQIINSLEKIILEECNDGFVFVLDKLEKLDHPHMLYPGCRLHMRVSFGNMKDKIQIDVGVGDAVIPHFVSLPGLLDKGFPLFDEDISVMAYPIETIFSEKLETVLSKGILNSRMKDYHDLLLLSRNRDLIDIERLLIAIHSTFFRRETKFNVIEFDAMGISKLQKLWAAHYKGLGFIAKEIIDEYSDVLQRLANK